MFIIGLILFTQAANAAHTFVPKSWATQNHTFIINNGKPITLPLQDALNEYGYGLKLAPASDMAELSRLERLIDPHLPATDYVLSPAEPISVNSATTEYEIPNEHIIHAQKLKEHLISLGSSIAEQLSGENPFNKVNVLRQTDGSVDTGNNKIHHDNVEYVVSTLAIDGLGTTLYFLDKSDVVHSLTADQGLITTWNAAFRAYLRNVPVQSHSATWQQGQRRVIAILETGSNDALNQHLPKNRVDDYMRQNDVIFARLKRQALGNYAATRGATLGLK